MLTETGRLQPQSKNEVVNLDRDNAPAFARLGLANVFRQVGKLGIENVESQIPC